MHTSICKEVLTVFRHADSVERGAVKCVEGVAGVSTYAHARAYARMYVRAYAKPI